MIKITEKYKYLEAKFILSNPQHYSKKDIENAKKFLKNYPKTENPTKITDEQRAEIKRKNPLTYK